MGANGQPKKEKESLGGWLYGLFSGQTHPGNYCTPDQCFITNQQAFSSTNLIAPVGSDHPIPHIELNNSTRLFDIASSISLSELFPPELIQLITDAAQQGLLVSTLITLANEGVTDYLKGLHYQPNDIYWINQGVRALLLIALGTSPSIAITVPLAGYVLNSRCGLSKEKSNYVTTGLALGVNLLTTPMSFMEASLAIGISVGSSLMGSKITKSGYNFVRDTFFSAKKVEETKEHAPQITTQLS
ncbi:hypothetical protein [Legionella maioricensis]|uniref:Uncharacterized protein n=1 Tax=Legionella maioricensis TaxID=2896528 RepID=A0A9X2IAF4_9GAMM|nr:hypothetical protein [Legionella maioricensis]MCL9683600.1 hypothetical protein [Legionella maioricensis]MCL9687622.1 hypothetical protein [Legionella maioricensis]